MQAMDDKLPQDKFDGQRADDLKDWDAVRGYLACGEAHEVRRA